MASTTYEAFDDHQGRLCFDTNGNVVATRGLRVPAPWMVLSSKKFSGRKKEKRTHTILCLSFFKSLCHALFTFLFTIFISLFLYFFHNLFAHAGRYFFYNRDTNECMWSLPRSMVGTASLHEEDASNFRTTDTTEHRNKEEHICTTPESPSSPTLQVVSLPNLINPPHTHEGGVGGSHDSFLKSERSSSASASMLPSLKLLGGFGAFITKANNDNNQRRSSDSSGKTATLSADQSVNVTYWFGCTYMSISNPVVFV
jgi:hypothetical protein